MTSDYILELFRELDAAENDRHDKLNAQLGLPTAIVTVLGGVLAFYLDRFSAVSAKEALDGLQITFAICLWLFFGTIVAAIVFLILALFHYGYRHVSDPTDIHDYMQNMEAWYITIGAEQIPEKVERDLRQLMTEQYMECAVRNRLMNSVKAKYLYFSKCAIVAALFVLAASVYPFYKGVKRVDQVHKVQLVEQSKE